MSAIRILLVDDNRGFLKSAALLLSESPRFIIVGEAHSGYEALEKTKTLHPDLVLVDLAMPEMNGLETTRRIKQNTAPPRVIILTLYDNAEYRTAAEIAGADGFVAKSGAGIHLCPLIHTLFKGNGPTRSEAHAPSTPDQTVEARSAKT
ncbi:MAG: response regulator transcription factor [Anaerolineae bacterium]|nr:response regulator transcription factor [Anaerolineae bacterium]